MWPAVIAVKKVLQKCQSQQGIVEVRAIAVVGRAPKFDLGSVNLHGILVDSPRVSASDFDTTGDSTGCPQSTVADI